MKRTLKEIFFQAAECGMPSTWVVQYYIEGQAFCEAKYFKTEQKAQALADELTGDT